jgi:hypothetical protein
MKNQCFLIPIGIPQCNTWVFMYDSLTSWSWIILEKLTLVHLLKKLLSISWNPTAHYRVHKSPSLVPTFRQIHPVHTLPSYSYFFKIHFNIILPSTCMPSLHSGSFRLVFLLKLYRHFSSLPCATRPAHLNLFDLITWIVLYEETNYEGPNNVTFFFSLLLHLPCMSKYSP